MEKNISEKLLKKPWWNKKWGKDQICSISHTRLRPGKDKNGIQKTTILNCKHRFRTDSLFIWYNTNNFINNNYISCPICRAKHLVLKIPSLYEMIKLSRNKCYRYSDKL